VRLEPTLLLMVPVLILSVVVHEVAHGLVATWRGDPTARDSGRLTLNPLRHLDPIGSLLVPAVLALAHAPVLLGWARPMPVDRARLQDLRNDPPLVALAGPAANLGLALVFAAIAAVGSQFASAPVAALGVAGVTVNVALALLNLIPIPPLDGAWVLMRFLRLRHIVALHQLRVLGLVVVTGLLASPLTSGPLFLTPLRAMVRATLGLFGVPGGAVAW
jgi:Zn-dependent protease